LSHKKDSKQWKRVEPRIFAIALQRPRGPAIPLISSIYKRAHVFDSRRDMGLKLLSFVGLAAFLAFAWAISENRRKFPWKTVLPGIGLQMLLGVLLLKTYWGQELFSKFHTAATKLLSFAAEGTNLVFGPLGQPNLMAKPFGPENAFVFVIIVTGTIILVATISALLYHYGILQKIVQALAWVMQRLMHTSGSESLAAVSNVIMGQTEAPMVVKPYLDKMTRSELMALMTGGMATIAGGVMAAYIGMGIDAGHLLTASLMSAPATLVIAKIMIPETEVSETAAGATASTERETINGIEAMCHGASDGMKLSMNVIAMLIGFTAAVALANYLCGGFFGWFGWETDRPIQTIIGWLNSPFAFLMGVPLEDCVKVGQVMGERIVLNEFIGYLSLTGMKESLEPRSYILATYALCGFANFASIAIQIGGISALAPGRRKDLAQLGLRAMIGGVLASYMTATVVGILI
jgi:CNT family concentrative nucleoside transporter